MQSFHRYLLVEDAYPGRDRVQRGHYQLIDARTGKAINTQDPSEWKAVARPGRKVMLSVMLGIMMYYKSLGKYCPRCLSESLDNDAFDSWKTW